MKIKDRLKELRAKNNLTQLEFAGVLEVEKTLVAHWETSRSNPNLENLTKICEKFQITADWLLFGEKTGIVEEPGKVYSKTKPEQQSLSGLMSEIKELKKEMLSSLDSAAAEVSVLSMQNEILLSLLQEVGAAATGVPLEQWAQKTNKIKASVLEKSGSKDRN